MNSRNLYRFHKISGSNVKKKLTENKNSAPLISAQCTDSNPEKNSRRKKLKMKFYSKLYTEFLSVPLFLGSEDGSFFTILKLSIYTVKRNWAESPKSSKWDSQKKAQFMVLGHDLKLVSRHGFPLFALVQSRACCFCCYQVPCKLLGLMVATSFVVATLLAQCFSKVDVETTVSCRNFVVFIFFCFLSHDLSFESGLSSLLRCTSRLRF